MSQIVFPVLLALALSITAQAQVDTATILGTVTDPSGAAVPNVKLTARNQDTGFARTTTSSGDGNYLIPLLPIGPHYEVTAEAAGFKASVQTGIALELNQNAHVDVRLQIGQVGEKVEVNAAAPLVDTHSATSGEVVGTKRLEDLPLNGRNPLQLAGLVTGVAALSTRATLDAGNRSANTMSINGSRPNETDYQLNGVRFAGSYLNNGLNYPNPDALAEFNLITNPNSAEYGQYSGAVFTAVSKSGTNEFHGTLFEFLRNDKLNARNFFAATVPTLRQNQFGATAGGRIIKNRLFWFGSYEGFRIRNTALASSTPLTADERNGLIKSATPIKDPLTNQPFSTDAQGRYVIPANRINAVSKTILDKFIPVAPPTLVYQATGARAIDVNQYAGKIDYNISHADQVFVNGLYDKTTPSNPFMMGNFPTYGSINQTQLVRVISVNETHSFRPNLFNEFRFGFSAQEENYIGTGQISPADLGIQNWNYLDLPDAKPQSPTFGVTGRFGIGSNGLGKWREGGRNFQFTDIVRSVKGNHTIKAGLDFYHREHHLDANIADTGSFTFSGLWSGNPTADFLLGKISSELRVRYLNHPGYRAWTRALFFQDDWKIHPRFTLNFGLRYELLYPFVEYRAKEDREIKWNTHGGLPISGAATYEYGAQSQVLPLAPAGLVYPGDKTPWYPNGIPDSIIHLDKLQFQPRVGLAWDPFGDGKTSVRASAGFFSNAQYVDMQAQTSQDLPFVVVQVPVLPPGDLTNPYQGLPVFTKPTPQNLKTDPSFFQPFLPAFAYGWDPNYVMPRVINFTANIQRQIVPNLMVEAGYVGKLSRHLQVGHDINSANYIPGASTYANQEQRRKLAPGVFQSIWQQQAIGTADYNSLQAVVRYRFHSGLTLLTSYTWAHSIDTCSQSAAGGNCFMDPANQNRDRGSSAFDQRQVFASSFVYDVPGRFTGTNSRLLNGALTGWTLSGIVSARSGLPFNVVTGFDASFTAVGSDRPDLVGNPYFSGSRTRGQQIAAYLNRSAFANNQPGQYGNLGRNVFSTPGTFNSDLGLFKYFNFTETKRLQFRAEFFNSFNQTRLGGPISALISPAFGRITSAGDPRLIQLALKFLW